ncbi:MAG: nucleotidyltransferase domain-containing protein [Clostridia bacterium]|nr:nucleotidyltransferase domain-containing protein [Clostridia bacterium]
MFDEFMEELHNVKNQIVELYSPFKIILFGSLAKQRIKETSDIDLCIITKTENKRKLIADMYLKIDSKYPVDIIVYTMDEYLKYKDEKLSFLYKILNEGKTIYG